MVRLLIAAGLTAIALPALAGSIIINEAYARLNPHAKTGAVFFEVMNMAEAEDRLMGVRTDAAEVAELHTHIESVDGVMKMRAVDEGFAVPAKGTYILMRGADHVMLMGMSADLKDGDSFDLILQFEHAGEVPLSVQIDNARKPKTAGMKHDH